MRADQKPQSGFSDLVEEAGIGSLTWSRSSYIAATYYHHFVALFSAGILCFGLLEVTPWPVAVFCTILYGMYFGLRKRLSPQQEREFYRPFNQFIRAQASFVVVTLLIGLVPDAAQTSLWLLYVPVILLTSKHCSTGVLFAMVIQSCAALLMLRLWAQPALLAISSLFLEGADLLTEFLWIGLLSFILHYLVRNIQARNETIAAYSAVSTLGRDVNMTEAQGIQQWQPLLMTLIRYLGGECVSIWLSHFPTRELQWVASVRRNKQDRQRFDFATDLTKIVVPMDSSALIAQAARTGESQTSIARSKNADVPAACPGSCPICNDVSAELVVPINLGNHELRYTIGVLSVGFLADSFKERLLPQYQNFMQGLVNQAKPMLVYAQRLNELIALQSISRQVSHSLDLNQVLDSILNAIVDTLGFEFASISLVDADRKIVRAVRGVNVPQAWLDKAVHGLDSNDIQADIVRSGKTEVIAGWDERFDRHIWNEFSHAGLIRIFTPIGVPDQVTQQEHIIGTIEAGYHKTTRIEITPDQRRLLEAFIDQAALAIEQAQLLQRVQKKADILTTLHHVGQVIASARQPTQVLEEIAKNAAALLRADIVMLYRYHKDTHVVEPPVVFGELGKKFHPNLDLNQSHILSHLLKETQPYYSADAPSDSLLMALAVVEAEKAAKPKSTFIQRQNIKSFAGIPLLARGEIVGIMFVNYRARHQFHPDEKQVHELFAQQAAVAIKNAAINELERELVVREERNHLSRELHHSVSQALFGIKLQAQNAMNRLGALDEQVQADLRNILEIAHVASNETGFIIDELRAPIESRQLLRALDEYAQRITRWYGLQVFFEQDAQRPLLPQTERRLFRFSREALNNAVRHAHCQNIRINFRSDSHHIELSIADDGSGFDPTRIPPNKLGLISMRELATAAGGVFYLETSPGKGTVASLCIHSGEEAEEYVGGTA